MNRKMDITKQGFTLIELLACQPKALRRQDRAAFTLIELLVVIVIIGVLFAVALPVFENAGRKDTGRVANQLIGTMRLARQHAINKRQWTIVVFPNRDGGAYSGADGDELKKCLRSYAVLAVTNIQNVPGAYSIDELSRPEQIPDNMQFEFISNWKYLPDGIYFDDDWDTGGTATNGNYLFQYASTDFLYPLNPAQPNALVRTPALPARPMGAVLFRPNGRAYAMKSNTTTGKYWQDTDYSKIYLTAAKYYEESGGILQDPTDIPGPNTVLEIRNKTGQVGIWDGKQ